LEFSTILVAWYQLMQDGHVKLNPELAWKKQHSTEESCFHQQSGLTFKQETIQVLHLEQNFVWF
jgi:hypothetical protein